MTKGNGSGMGGNWLVGNDLSNKRFAESVKIIQ